MGPSSPISPPPAEPGPSVATAAVQAPTAGPPGNPGATAAIIALRAQGAHRVDPVRFGYLEALARRSAAHGGELRRALDQRLDQALAAFVARHGGAGADAGQDASGVAARSVHAAGGLDRPPAAPELAAPPSRAAQPEARAIGGPLAELVRQIDRQAQAQWGTTGAAASAPGRDVAAAPELRALSEFRGTWARLSVDRQLSLSQQSLSGNAGPLNSQRLLLRALRLMQQVAPAYLDGFVANAEALLWLDRAAASPPAPGKRRDGHRKRPPGARIPG